jgi:hypothetical protein
MFYDLIELKDGSQAIREVSADGRVVRWCDADGNTVEVTSEPQTIIQSLTPAWALPDPVPEPQPEPAPVTNIITKLAYMNRFQDAELAAIFTAAKSEVAIEIWLEKFKVAEFVDLADPVTIAGVQALEAFGLIGAGRAGEILNA